MARARTRRNIVVLVLVLLGAGVVWFATRPDDGVDVARIQGCTGQPVVPVPTVTELDLDAAGRLEPVADVPEPTSAAVLADGTMFVTEREGRLWAVPPTGDDPRVVLDIAEQVSTGEELGLLGVASDGAVVWITYTDAEWTVHLVEYGLEDDRPVLDTRRELLAIEQPEPIHNGGHLLLGPDGMLYLGSGDGGDTYDTAKQAPDLGDLHGKLLRIDPAGDDGPDGAYGIPPDNPHVGVDGARGEVWLSGLRNPWTFSFAPDGALWIGDVGSNCWEEIDRIPPGGSGQDLGWPDFEGFQQAVADEDDGTSTFPVYDYPHGGACAVVAGHVYRGPEDLPELEGRLVFADLCQPGRLQVLEVADDGSVARGTYLEDESVGPIVSFAEGPAGELYVVGLNGGVWELVRPAPAAGP